MSGRAGLWRPIGFLVLMVGLGFRLDTAWQGLGATLVVVGACVSGAGLLMRRSEEPTASVREPVGR